MKLGYVIIYVPDVIKAVEFYEKAFGLTRKFVHESGYAELLTGETALAFASEALRASNGVEIALVTNDVKAAYDQAVSAGASPYKKPEQKPWGQIVGYVRDLNGFLVEICSPVGA